MTKPIDRPAKYDAGRVWRSHDGSQPWQVCRECGYRCGEGLVAEHDDVYYAEGHDPAVCPVPGCGGEMGIDRPTGGEPK